MMENKNLEHGKIANEIYGELNLNDFTEKIYWLGFATALSGITDFANHMINGDVDDQIDIRDIKDWVETVAKSEKEVSEYYARLRKDGTMVDLMKKYKSVIK